MKKQKYSNGSLVVRKDFKGIGSIEGNVSGTHNYGKGNITARKTIGGATVSADMFKDSKGNTGSSYSIDKQLPKNKSVNAYSNKGGSGEGGAAVVAAAMAAAAVAAAVPSSDCCV